MRLLGLAYTQGQGHLRRFLQKEYAPVFRAFMESVKTATPNLTDEERFWRIHFMLGATIFTLSGSDSLTAMAEHDLGKGSNIAQVIERLIPFLAEIGRASCRERVLISVVGVELLCNLMYNV